MQWIITKDVLHKGENDVVPSRVGHGWWTKTTREAFSPGSQSRKDFTPEQKMAFAETLPYEFRLYDDDDELYFEGKCGDLAQADESKAFAPLDWAMNDAGCTTMKYRKVGHAIWSTL